MDHKSFIFGRISFYFKVLRVLRRAYRMIYLNWTETLALHLSPSVIMDVQCKAGHGLYSFLISVFFAIFKHYMCFSFWQSNRRLRKYDSIKKASHFLELSNFKTVLFYTEMFDRKNAKKELFYFQITSSSLYTNQCLKIVRIYTSLLTRILFDFHPFYSAAMNVI